MDKDVERLNMRQIAKLAGVSPATVSRVLNGRCDSKNEKHKRVMEVLRSNGYERKKRIPPKATILCVNEYSEEMATAHSLRILAYLDEIASRLQCEFLTLHSADYDRIKTRISDRSVDGVIFLGDVVPKVLEKPAVILNRNAIDGRCFSVDCDEIVGLVTLLDHLKKLGHTRIAYFSDICFNRNSLTPRKSYEVLKAFSLAGVNNPIIWEFDLHPGEETGIFAEIAARMIALPDEERPTALLLCGDVYASFAYKVFAERGIRIPERLSVAGFDDEPMSARLAPPLTTIAKPLEQMCEIAVELILKSLAGNLGSTRRVLIKPELVLRKSVVEKM